MDATMWCIALYGGTKPCTADDALNIANELHLEWQLKPGRVTLKWSNDKKSSHPKFNLVPGLIAAFPGRALDVLAVESARGSSESDRYEICLDANSKMYSVGISSARSGVDIENVEQISAKLTRHLLPTYGFADTIKRSVGSTFYCSGIPYNVPLGSAEERMLLEFQDMKDLVIDGPKKLRDVYRINVLSGAANRIPVDSWTLFDWIRRFAKGRLTMITPDHWLWRIPEQLIPRIRSELQAAGALILS